MKKTVYVYSCKFSSKMRYYDRKQKETADKQWEFIGTTEIEITPPVKEKPFPKPMKWIHGDSIVYFTKQGCGYVLVGDDDHPNNKYAEDWITQNFTDIKGLKEVV